MIRLCRSQGLPGPVYEEVTGGFQVTFRKDVFTPESLRTLGLNERQILLLGHLRTRPSARLSDFVGIGPTASMKTVQRDLQDLVTRGLVRATGEKKGRKYELAR